MNKKHILDSSVIRQRMENCAVYRRKTMWLWLVALFSTVAPIVSLFVFGMSAFPVAFASFAGGLLVIGVRLSTCTTLLYCPHCGHRPIRHYRPAYDATTFRLRSPLKARFCEHCYYWLEQPEAPYG